jgi:cystathionine beta-synthase
MQWYDNILETIGNTPLVKLNKVTGGISATLLAKIEFFNPAGSVKDRMAIFMIEEAAKRGLIKPGGTIVENTSGNTGAALAMYASVKGYKIIFTIPDKMSEEKINRLKAFGAKVVICPTDVPADSPESYYETAKRIAKETPNSYLVNQYHNEKNVEAHYKLTGPEIWAQTEGKIDYFVAGIGTGGTISGVGKFLKEKDPKIKVIGVDPIGSVYYNYFKDGTLIEPKVYMVEGIGEDMLCKCVHFDVIDDIIQINDKEAFQMARRLAREEGIFAGGSSGGAVHAALKVAKDAKKDEIIVVILPDTGHNYLSKIFNDEWMKEKGFI